MFNDNQYIITLRRLNERDEELDYLLEKHYITLNNHSVIALRTEAFDLLARGHEHELHNEKGLALQYYQDAIRTHNSYFLESLRTIAGSLIMFARERIDGASRFSFLDEAVERLEQAQQHYQSARSKNRLVFEARSDLYKRAAVLAERAFDSVEGDQWQDSSTNLVLIAGLLMAIAGFLVVIFRLAQ